MPLGGDKPLPSADLLHPKESGRFDFNIYGAAVLICGRHASTAYLEGTVRSCRGRSYRSFHCSHARRAGRRLGETAGAG